uniref:Uncharacterized protein n=2 Tax=Auxenochlorella protothecoides TaxID=3075 RepID=A0A1D1ZMJ7_AUXPR
MRSMHRASLLMEAVQPCAGCGPRPAPARKCWESRGCFRQRLAPPPRCMGASHRHDRTEFCVKVGSLGQEVQRWSPGSIIAVVPAALMLSTGAAWADSDAGGGPPVPPPPFSPAVTQQRPSPATLLDQAAGLTPEQPSAPPLVDPPSASGSKAETSGTSAVAPPEAVTPTPAEETPKPSKKRRRSRLGELQEIRQQLAQRELELLSKERSLSARDQDISVLQEELEIERKLRALLTKDKEKAEEEAALAFGLCTGTSMLP